jgi:hypothetical protein
MVIMRTRRGFLTAMSAAGALGLFGAPRVLAGEGPLETTSVRLLKSSLICSAAPQFAGEALLRAEGFKEIVYVEVPRTELAQAFSDDSLRLHEAGLIKATPNQIMAENIDWHFFDELKRELRA